MKSRKSIDVHIQCGLKPSHEVEEFMDFLLYLMDQFVIPEDVETFKQKYSNLIQKPASKEKKDAL